MEGISLRNVRYLIQDEFQANQVADDLKVQLDINRMETISITSVESRNEVIVQIPEANESVEEVLSGFMRGYQKGMILE